MSAFIDSGHNRGWWLLAAIVLGTDVRPPSNPAPNRSILV
jgi:hypothetical protein